MKKLQILIMDLALVLTALFGFTIPAFAVGADEGTGSIIITNPQTGTDYAAYQIFSASYSTPTGTEQKGVTYFADEATKTFFEGLIHPTTGQSSNPFVFTKTPEGNYQVTMREGYPDDVIAQFFNHYRKEIETQFASKKFEPSSATASNVEFSPVPYGYYYVTSTSGSMVSLTTAAPTAQVIEKTQAPVIDESAKKVREGDQWVDWSGTSVGDVRDFRILFSASNYVGAVMIPFYTITDTSTNLEIDPATLELTIGDKVIPQSEFAAQKITMSNADGKLTVQIPWVDDAGQPLYEPSPVDVQLTYQATVQEGAAQKGASNTAEIAYSDQSIASSVNLASYSFKLNKYDKESADKGSPVTLNGATFTLWTAAENGERIYVTPAPNGGYNVVGTGTSAANDTMIEAGMTTIYGLNEGTYYLQEENAPDGYNRLNSRVEVSIHKPSAGQGENVVDVLNAKGAMLPGTGASENFVIYAASLLLASAAFVLFFVYARKNSARR